MQSLDMTNIKDQEFLSESNYVLSRPYVRKLLIDKPGSGATLRANIKMQLGLVVKDRKFKFINVSQPNHMASILYFDKGLYNKSIPDIKEWYRNFSWHNQNYPSFIKAQINPDLQTNMSKL